jgi:hypothetical protein
MGKSGEATLRLSGPGCVGAIVSGGVLNAEQSLGERHSRIHRA